MNKKALTIAIDGYSSCGKSTMAKQIAARLGYLFIDTGAMYRAVTLAAMRAGDLSQSGVEQQLKSIDVTFRYNKEAQRSDIYLNGERVEDAIRTMEVSDRVSMVSAYGAVREKLVALQQQMGRDGGVVMDGRDIGTVVFPHAQIKIFMVADARVRGERRYKEMIAKGESITLEEVVESIEQRDRADEQRAISPLRRADDAILLDNSYMSVEQQMEWFERVLSERCE